MSGNQDNREPALFDALDLTRNDPGPFLIYADWLQSRGDAQGELIVVQHALSVESDLGRKQALQAREAELLEAHATGWAWKGLQVEWRWGFARRLILDAALSQAQLARLLDAPVGRLLREIDVRQNPQAHLDSLLQHGRPALLRQLELGENRLVTRGRRIPTVQGDAALRNTAEIFSCLESLGVRIRSVNLGELPFPSLKALVLEPRIVSVDNVRSLSQPQWPALESLSINNLNTGSDGRDKVALIEQWQLPQLKQLAFGPTGYSAMLIDVLLRAPWVQQLERLEFREGALSSLGATALAERPTAFPRLRRLVVERFLLEDAVCLRLQEAFGSKVELKERPE